jgi:hypothetical protein
MEKRGLNGVRREIQTALEAGVLVVPVLVDDARPLTAVDLRTVPEIQKLAEKQSELADDHQTTSALRRTYTDSETGLMWAIRDNGTGVELNDVWRDARAVLQLLGRDTWSSSQGRHDQAMPSILCSFCRASVERCLSLDP